MSRSRGWCFTINNPSTWDDLDIESLSTEPSVQYLVYGLERGELGTSHYQGFVRFKSLKSFDQIQRALQRAHIEPQRGTNQQAADYCKKENQFKEFGILPQENGARTREMWKEVIQLSESGDLESIKERFPHIYFLHLKRIIDLRLRHSGIMPGPLRNEWWVGPTGTGKSRRLWEMYPQHFQKSCNKWWDGYNDEDVVAIEEFSPEHGKYLGHYMKIWADRYPFTPEIKGSHLKRIRPTKIIVLSNYSIEDCFEKVQDVEPIKRRFQVIHFPRTPFITLN